MKSLISKIIRTDKWSIEHGEGFLIDVGSRKVHTDTYEICTKKLKLIFWNSSNNANLYDWDTLKKVLFMV